ncbi:MAG TPA: KpsF/GutQ family sugar-phosphate isomerase [Aquificales bacterium]|uniref:KpsF/GutQ family sugar-phosphate isomerase n=1 Tax=Aquifex aeolicus TaxID=63363 RepID=A0A9D0YPL0_AQUAO|nr:KpsF/GutQ family sugar-phosphate isomerase [Aquificales bacterium]HIP98264.1 KpsF/GutQ family sugar-phosphate isomerase [Aquifex aeolicus]
MDILKIAEEVIDIEIEQLKRLKSCLNENFERAVEIVLSCNGKVVLTGIGKSGIIAKKISATLSSTGTPSFFLHPAEALHGDLGMVSKGDVVIAISNSGQSQEVLAMLPYFKRLGIPVIAVTNNPQSELAKRSDVVLNLCVEKEACPMDLVPTSSTTNTLVLGDALALTVMKLRGFSEQDFGLRHPAGSLGRKLKTVADLGHFEPKEIPIVHENTSMKEVVLEISSKGFGATAVVNDEGKLVGIITDGDLRRFVQRGGDFNRDRAKDVMTKNPKTITADRLAMEALKLMEDYKITVLIVVDEQNRPIGIIHIHDIMRGEFA